MSRSIEGRWVDVFSFTQGYGAGNRAGRVAFHATAHVASLGLWEIVGTPLETVFDGTPMRVEVFYDAEDRVAQAGLLPPLDAAPLHGSSPAEFPGGPPARF